MIVITNEHGKPVAVAPSMERAQEFVYRNVHRDPEAPVQWTETGKHIVGGRWTGWEAREVQAT